MGALKNLLAAGITLGLSDREGFVKKVSGIIEEYQENPDKAERWAETLAKYLEEMREDIRLQRNLSNVASGSVPKEDVEQLTKAIQELTKELQQQKKG